MSITTVRGWPSLNYFIQCLLFLIYGFSPKLDGKIEFFMFWFCKLMVCFAHGGNLLFEGFCYYNLFCVLDCFLQDES